VKTSRWLRRLTAVLLAMAVTPAFAAINPDEVLVIYNSQATTQDSNFNSIADSLEVFNYYSSVHPGVLGFDLNDATLVPAMVSYTDFESKIRDKIRTHLTNNSLTEQVRVITLTRGIPHRISDIDAGLAGDAAGTANIEFNAGDATYASVDSELTLLQLNLRSGEGGGTMDSAADNHILNPYFGSTTSFGSLSRSSVTTAKTLENLENEDVAWVLHENSGGSPPTPPGAIYLTARLDGNSVQNVIDTIDRAQNVTWNQNTDQIIVDDSPRDLDNAALFSPASADPGYGGNDYDESAALLAGQYNALVTDLNDPTADPFLIGTNNPSQVTAASKQSIAGPVAYLASYGQNHSTTEDEANYVNTFNGQLVDGAIFNTIESFNGRAFGGLGTLGDQGQVSGWLANGGTFGVGNVWEPFAHTVANNEMILTNVLFNNLTFVEAAWSSIPWISWQQIVVGDPLATISVVPEPSTAGLITIGAGLSGILRRFSRRRRLAVNRSV
jgi:hypothetical protein